MTVRAPLEEVLSGPGLTSPSLEQTLFIVAQGGVEQKLTASRAGILLSNTGYTGSRGPTGFTGSYGYFGSVGFVGSVGFTGSVGFRGSVGYTGSTGTLGFTGFTGSRSTASGYTGSTGTTGFTGSRGFVGSRGDQGLPGVSLPSQFSNTSTNIAGGRAGNIPIQRGSSSTAFISTGSVGYLLQYQAGNTATWVSTSTITVASAGSAFNSDQIYATTLPVTGRTGDQYITMVTGGGGYRSIGVQSNLIYNVTTNLLTVSKAAVTDTTNLMSTTTNALVVTGGVGIGGSLNVFNTATILATTSATSTITGALVVAGGAGIKGDLWVGGIINGTISGSITIASNVAGGTVGQLVYQRAINSTDFVGAGTTGNLLVSRGANASGPYFVSTGSIQVGYAENLLKGAPGYLPYQLQANTTRFLAIGTPGYVLTVNAGGTAPEWKENTGGGGGGTINVDTANNLAGGASGVIPYQVISGQTDFTAAGNDGDILTSRGTLSPEWVARTSLVLTNLAGGSQGTVVYQSAADTTAFLNLGSAGQVLTVNSGETGPEWTTLVAPPAEYANTATNIKLGTQGQIPFQASPGQTKFFGPGTKGQLLISAGTTSTGPIFTNTATFIIGYSVNIINGTAGQLVYQSSTSTTNFVGPGTIGQFLVSQGVAAPQYKSPSSLTVGYATNIVGGTAGQLPYQFGASTTRFTGPGSSGDLLVSDATNGPSFVTTSNVKVGYAALADAVKTGGSVPQILTVKNVSNANYYPTFVDTNNNTATAMTVYTNSAFVINPSTGFVYLDYASAQSGARLSVNGGGYFNGTVTATTVIATTLTGNIQGNALTSGQVTTALGFTPYNATNPSNYITLTSLSMDTPAAASGSGGMAYDNATGKFKYTPPNLSSYVTGTPWTSVGYVTGTPWTSVGYLTAVPNASTQLTSLGVGTTPTGTVGEIVATNEITAYYSDRRLKENVKVIDNAIEKVLTLNGITYTPNDLAESFGYNKNTKIVGLFADEVNAVLPEAVKMAPFDRGEDGNSKSGENYKTIQYEKLVPLLVEAIKELAKEVSDLKKEANGRSL
jgi:hypothetical protein